MRTSDARPRVFSVEGYFKHDVSDAARHGDIVVLLPKASPGDQWSAPRYAADILAALETHDYEPDVDMLLCAGTSMSLFIASATIAGKYGRVRGLFWNGKHRRLEPLSICLDSQEKNVA